MEACREELDLFQELQACYRGGLEGVELTRSVSAICFSGRCAALNGTKDSSRSGSGGVGAAGVGVATPGRQKRSVSERDRHDSGVGSPGHEQRSSIYILSPERLNSAFESSDDE